MLQKLRDQTQSTAAKIVVGLLVFVLTVFGFGAFNLFATGQQGVASVDGDEITRNEFVRASQLEAQRLAAELGPEFDPADIDPRLLEGRVLEQLIGRKVLEAATDELGIGASQQAVARLVRSNPAFQVDGAFSEATYRLRVQNLGYSPQQFLEETRRAIAEDQLRLGVVDSSLLTEWELRGAARLLSQKRDFAYLTFNSAAYADQVDVSDDEIRLRFDENQLDYQTEEKADAQYVQLSWGDLIDDPEIDITEEDIRAAYEAEREAALANEQRNSSHILLRVTDDRPEADAIAEINNIRERVLGGEEFAELAKNISEDPGSARLGGDLGSAGKGVFDPAFEEALFELGEPGDLSEPVVSQFGVHLIRLNDVVLPTHPEFDEARDAVAARLREDEARALFTERVRLLDELVFENPDALEAAADAFGLDVKSVSDVTRDAGPDVFEFPEVREALFTSEVFDEGRNSPVIELNDASAVAVRAVEIYPLQVRPFDEVRDEIAREIRSERAFAAMNAAADDAIASLESGDSVSDVARRAGLEWQRLTGASRTDNDADARVVRSAFDLPNPGASRRSVGDVVLDGGDRAVVVVTRVSDGNLDNLSTAERDDIRRYLRSRAGQLDFSALYESAESRVSIVRPTVDASG